MRRYGTLLTVLAMLLTAGPASATVIGDAHRVLNATYRSQADGFWHGRITRCNHVLRRDVACRVALTEPTSEVTSCQGGTQRYNSVGIGVCESTNAATIELTVRNGRMMPAH